MMSAMTKVYFFLFVSLSFCVKADLEKIEDKDLSSVTGQAGVYLTGEVSINEEGGPLENSYFGACSDNTKICGARLSFQTQQDGGWFVLDNIKGSISFEGLTFQVRNISSGFGGDGALFNRDVMEIGLPESIRMNDFQYTLATGSSSRPTDGTYKQVDLMTVEMSGDLTLQGNLLVFPTP
tara:strand:+ start:1169 stop:1708 length:540 start_codon:yes stop_codon:yes gene_type:complete